jgi:transcriptional accessory protein Tex/SPT6
MNAVAQVRCDVEARRPVMSDTCRNCGKAVDEQSPLHNWDSVCSHCGQLLWLRPGDIRTVRVARLLRYGITAELGDGIEGLVHVTELAAEPLRNPTDAVSVGSIVPAKVLRIDLDERKIGLSIKRAAH